GQRLACCCLSHTRSSFLNAGDARWCARDMIRCAGAVAVGGALPRALDRGRAAVSPAGRAGHPNLSAGPSFGEPPAATHAAADSRTGWKIAKNKGFSILLSPEFANFREKSGAAGKK